MTLNLDPEVAAALAPMGEAMAATTPPAVDDITGRRAMWEPILAAASAALPTPADVTITDHQVPTGDGAHITVRWYAKDGAAAGPAAVFFHGGGYIFGHIDQFDGPVARYVSESGVPFLSVEYRRAPEYPHPTPVEDGYAALSWLIDRAPELGVDPGRIAVMGDKCRRRARRRPDDPRPRTRGPRDRTADPAHADARRPHP
nr:alpha/beta hydrolase fold domain-containing protein [Phytoactinopolyspora endophytica]